MSGDTFSIALFFVVGLHLANYNHTDERRRLYELVSCHIITVTEVSRADEYCCKCVVNHETANSSSLQQLYEFQQKHDLNDHTIV